MTLAKEQVHSRSVKQDDPRVVIVLFSLLSVLPFLLVIDGPFLFDDHLLIVQDQSLHSFRHLADLLLQGFWDGGIRGDLGAQGVGQYFRPIVLLSFALDWQLGGGLPWAFHLSNIVLQALAAILTMAVLLRWFNGDAVLALLAGVFFALHPSKAESVAWISGRTDLLMMIGCMLSLYGQLWGLGWGLGDRPFRRAP